MNERIRGLLNEATSGLDPDLSPQRTVTLNEMEKFAELIVKEMLQTCEDHPAWTGRMIGEQIKQHFGVEE